LVELQNQLNQIEAQGLGLAAISYDSPEILAAFAKQHAIKFPLLSDAGSSTIKRYGILNPFPERALGPRRNDAEVVAGVSKYVSLFGVRPAMAGMAFPGTFVVNRRGLVTARFFEDSYIERITVSNILVQLKGPADSSAAATKISTNHLDVIAYASDSAVAPGNRFSLVLEVKPHAGLHVYAPGAEASGYRVIALGIEPNALIRVLPVQYPKAEIYYFKPLKQRVPVFEKPFRMVQEVVLEGTPASQAALRAKQELTLNGTLQYQACDEKICYNPVSVPLSWTLGLRSIIRETPAVGR
jgi:peroxiredoxin